uniref:HORMA domain-containing protein n=2 Tax=Caenorhabditis japonica TaxID=281687 RepID=A0A8R1DNJ4_CAEJA
MTAKALIHLTTGAVPSIALVEYMRTRLMAPPFHIDNDEETLNDTRSIVNDQKWLRIFPRCVASKDKSSKFMTRAVFVTFSMILYRRNILRKEYFATNYVAESLKLKTLDFNHQKAQKIAHILKSAGEAIALGYLDEIALVISNSDGKEEAIEVFSFKIHYFPDGGVVAQLNAEANGGCLTPVQKLANLEYEGTASVRDQFILMHRSIAVICQKIMQPLPDRHFANFRVKYTKEAPIDYRIKGFSDSPIFYTHHKDVLSANLGPLRPGCHGGVLGCASIFIEDSSRAEYILNKHIEKAAEELGWKYAINNSLPNTDTANMTPSSKSDDTEKKKTIASKSKSQKRSSPYSKRSDKR